MKENDCYFEKIFITHSHFDHMGGAINVIEAVEKLGYPTPKVYKFVDGNKIEESRLDTSQKLRDNTVHAKEGDSFVLSESLDDGQTTINLEI